MENEEITRFFVRLYDVVERLKSVRRICIPSEYMFREIGVSFDCDGDIFTQLVWVVYNRYREGG